MCEGSVTVVSAMFGVAIILGGGYVLVKRCNKWRHERRVDQEFGLGSEEENIPLREHVDQSTHVDSLNTPMSRSSSSMVTVATQFSSSDETFECVETSPSSTGVVDKNEGAPRQKWLGLW